MSKRRVKNWDKRTWLAGDLRFAKPEKGPDGRELNFFYEWESAIGKDDMVLLLGNLATENVAHWFRRISDMPGQKVLFLGQEERNRPGWYTKFGFKDIVPFNECIIYQHWFGPIMFSHVPAFPAVNTDQRFLNLSSKFERWFGHSSCIINIHAATRGVGKERQNTFDISADFVGAHLLTLEQILSQKFENYGRQASLSS